MSRPIALILSFIGHPLLVLTYVLLLMMWANPFAFGVGNLTEKRALILFMAIFVCTAFLPIVGLLLMRALGFVKSNGATDKQERIGPYIMSGVFYLWLFKNLLSGNQTPLIYTAFVLGATISLFLAFFINIFTKISAHATGMGAFVAMLLVLGQQWAETAGYISVGGWTLSWLVVIALGVVLAGAIGVARLSLSDHEPADIYRGYAAGAVAVFVATSLLI
jgi:hypothetical protein